jgi:hypothetical protein
MLDDRVVIERGARSYVGELEVGEMKQDGTLVLEYNT